MLKLWVHLRLKRTLDSSNDTYNLNSVIRFLELIIFPAAKGMNINDSYLQKPLIKLNNSIKSDNYSFKHMKYGLCKKTGGI